MGQDRHPDWLLNLRADRVPTCCCPAARSRWMPWSWLPPSATSHWPDLLRAIPQLRTYVRRTTRDIPVVRLAAR